MDALPLAVLVVSLEVLHLGAMVFWVRRQVNHAGPARGEERVRRILADPAAWTVAAPLIADQLKPGLMKNGMTGSETVAIRYQREAAAQGFIMGKLTEKYGLERAGVIWKLVPDELKKSVMRLGENGWFEILAPWLEKAAAFEKKTVATKTDAW